MIGSVLDRVASAGGSVAEALPKARALQDAGVGSEWPASLSSCRAPQSATLRPPSGRELQQHRGWYDASTAGFTILEMLLVVSIAVITLAVAVPNVVATLDGYRLNSSARMVAGRLLETRINAIKRNRAAQLAINVNGQDVRIRTTDDNGNTIQVGAEERISNGVRFVADTTPAQVAFDSTGRPTGVGSGGIRIQLRPVAGLANRVVTITVSAGGSIRVR